MTNPARSTRARVIAAIPAEVDQSDVAYAAMTTKLAGHYRRLNLASTEAELASLMAGFLPEYVSYVTAEVTAATGSQNNLLLTIMLWRFAVGDAAGAMDIAEYAVASGMKLRGQGRLENRVASAMLELSAERLAAGSFVDPAIIARARTATSGKVPLQLTTELEKAIEMATISKKVGELQ